MPADPASPLFGEVEALGGQDLWEGATSAGAEIPAAGPIPTWWGGAVDYLGNDLQRMLDGDLGIVLLNWSDGDWRVVETAIAPTDVPQIAWPDEHHVSPALVGLEGG